LRFWDHEVLRHIEAVKQVIGETIGVEFDTPSLILPRKGGGNKAIKSTSSRKRTKVRVGTQ
jgi:class 3 adenylate cyclase